MAVKEGTTVAQEGVSDRYSSAKAAMQQATKLPMSVYVTSTAKEEKK